MVVRHVSRIKVTHAQASDIWSAGLTESSSNINNLESSRSTPDYPKIVQPNA